MTVLGKLAYARGNSSPPLIEWTIGALFEQIVRAHHDREALVVRHQDCRLTYAQLARRVDTLGAGLLALGLRKGDRVGIWSPNCVEWLLVQLATAKAGLILVNINPAYRVVELQYALNKVGCKALVMSARVRSSDYLGMLVGLAPELRTCRPGELRSAALPDLRTVICLSQCDAGGILHFDAVSQGATDASRAQLAAIAATLVPDDAVNIQFTSGTTGAPKGATLTHRNILNNGFLVGEALGFTEADRLCIPVPLYHCFGMVMGNLGCITHGATMIYPSELFDPLAVLQAIEAERCTALYGVPTMFIAQLGHPEFSRFDLSSLRTGIMSGAPCPIEVMRQVASVMHMREVTIAYGMTETSPVSTQTSRSDPIERRVSTVGRVQPHVEIQLVDESGTPVARGLPGEFCTRGYSVMRGYWGDDTRTREAIDADGWMHTGDLAVMDDDGYVRIVGRLKDMVIRGGENIYPREIEEYLYRNPQVQDVSVVGVPDPKYGEELCACIILREGSSATEDDMREFCRGQIAHYKVPRYVRFVRQFPMTITGKVQKYLLREQSAQELGLEEPSRTA
ncbi:MAG: AMP-binding protein [Proteobacteria bacterium]|nr:AMP-binding protein [Pseudomonadota bacterium]